MNKHDELSQAIDNMLVFMELSPVKQWMIQGKKVSIRQFDGAEPILPGLNSEATGLHDDLWLFGDVKPTDLSEPLDIRAIINNYTSTEPGAFAATRFRSVSAKDVRGRVQRQCRYFVEMTALLVSPGKESRAIRYIIGSNDGLTWKCVDSVIRNDNDEENTDNVRFAHGMQFNRDYVWTVQLGYEGANSVTMTTDPAGARSVFRLRDIPEGRQRRAALRHWVEQHWRKKYDSPEDEIFVRNHLRGATTFVWNGLVCRISPSPDDLARAEKARVDRELMKRRAA